METLEIIDLRREARLRGDTNEYRCLNGVRNAAIRRDSPNPDSDITTMSLTEVKESLIKLKNSKAPNLCSITAEMLNAGGDNLILWLQSIINSVWISKRLPNDLRSQRRPQQPGFMPNRSTTDHISALRLLIENVRDFRRDRHLFIGFIDLKAAFDTVDHLSLWNILKILGVPQKILSLFQRLYGDAESCVHINRKESDWFPINSGVRQGCVTAPDLFNSIIDYLMTRVSNRIPGFSPKFTYLGSTITQTGDLKPEIDRRRGLATGTMQALWRPLWRHRAISQKTKLRVYNASVLSVLFNGSETWLLNKILEARLGGFDSRVLRTIEGTHWTQHVTNQEVRQRTQQTDASRLAAQRCIRWYGHVQRISKIIPHVPSLTSIPGWPDGGAPRTRWLDVVAQDLRDCGITLADTEQQAQDRPRWQALVKMVGFTRSDAHE
ncbi:uncharacterized protein LOC122261430 [Penaeus japonicus]|uniref:uncharacterized protein LOC122261430 n=1 Tax=Penaeus japonicus TaxID=27405 RepID=UPI001C716D09|nr:uncharacterized protein LOC122261430 [Penaeus japonicus]